MPHQIHKNNEEIVGITVSQLVFFHLEQMSENYWWAIAETPESSIHLNFGAEQECQAAILLKAWSHPKDEPQRKNHKIVTSSWEIRNNQDGTLDEVVSCHPRNLVFKKESKDWILELETKHKASILISFESDSPIQMMIDVEPNPVKHRCVLCCPRS